MLHFTPEDIDWTTDYHEVADDLAKLAVDSPQAFSAWERDFIASLHLIHYFSDKQVVALVRTAVRLGALAEVE